MIREWARAQGMQVGDRGLLPRHVVEAYKRAHGISPHIRVYKGPGSRWRVTTGNPARRRAHRNLARSVGLRRDDRDQQDIDMSKHHDESGHLRDRVRVKRVLEAQLPLPCVECGKPVTADQSWHVAHIQPASMGGRTTLDNCGPAHAHCNLVAGGRLGAAVVNTTRRSNQGIRPW